MSPARDTTAQLPTAPGRGGRPSWRPRLLARLPPELKQMLRRLFLLVASTLLRLPGGRFVAGVLAARMPRAATWVAWRYDAYRRSAEQAGQVRAAIAALRPANLSDDELVRLAWLTALARRHAGRPK